MISPSPASTVGSCGTPYPPFARCPKNRIKPNLPANIEPGHAREFTAKITADQIARAKWVEWQWEGITNRAPWHATDTFESVADKIIARDEVNAIFQKLKVRQEYQQHKGGAITKGITFTNDTNMSVAVLDLRVLDASSAEIVNFRRPHGRITPALPLNVEPRHAIQITVELTQHQTERGAWLEWEETGGDKPRVPWTHRDVSVELAPLNARAEANPVTVGTGESAPDGSADLKQGKGERK